MSSLKNSEWDFTNVRSDYTRLLDACFWEYGRECKKLVEMIASLRSLLAESHPKLDAMGIAQAAVDLAVQSKNRLGKATGRKAGVSKALSHCAEELNAFMGHLNWGLFCSPDFPTRPWFDGGRICPIRANQGIFFEFADRAEAKKSKIYEPRNVLVDMGRVSREGKGATSTAGDTPSHSQSDLRASMTDLESHLSWAGRPRIHCFLVHDALLDLRTPESLIQFFSSQIYELSRRRVLLRSNGAKNPPRQHPLKWLGWLGALRLQHGFPKETVRIMTDALLGRSKKSKLILVSDPRKEKYEAKERNKRVKLLLNNKKHSVYRRSAARVFSMLFRVGSSEKPISFPLYKRDGRVAPK